MIKLKPTNDTANHQGFPVSSGFGNFSGLSDARYGSFESLNAIDTFSGLAFGEAARATNSLSSSIEISGGNAALSKVTAIEISSIVPELEYSFVCILETPY